MPKVKFDDAKTSLNSFSGRVAMRSACDRALDALPGGFHGLAAAVSGKKVMATGCSGFFGIWVLSALDALRGRGVEVQALIASSGPERFLAEHPRWRDERWARWSGPDAMSEARFDFALGMGARSDNAHNMADPVGSVASMVASCAALTKASQRVGARMLFVSSGAVYGPRVLSQGPCREEQAEVAPARFDRRGAYAQGKRCCETLVASLDDLDWVAARPFAFIGPHLPLDRHFAAGNFMADARLGRAPRLLGDGSARRSYMHPSDMAAWLLWLMALGPRGAAVNVGGGEPLSMLELAHMVAQAWGDGAGEVVKEPQCQIANPPDPDFFVPDLERAMGLGLRQSFSTRESIDDALFWLAASGGAWRLPQGVHS